MINQINNNDECDCIDNFTEDILNNDYVREYNKGNSDEEIRNILSDKKRLDWLEEFSKSVSIIPLKGISKEPAEIEWTKWCETKRPYDRNEFIGCNAGIATGGASSLIVLDIDNMPLFESFRKRYDIPELPKTYTVQTGSSKSGFEKLHYYYLYPNDGKDYGCKTKKILGFDIRGKGGQVVAPGSIHPYTKRMYEVKCSEQIAELPEWILDFYNKKDNRPEWTMINLDKLPESTKQLILKGKPTGERSEQVMTVLNSLVSKGLSDDQIFYIFYTYPIGEKFFEKGYNRDQYLFAEIDNAKKYVGKNNSSQRVKLNKTSPRIEIVTANDFAEQEYSVSPLIDDLLDEHGSLLVVGSTGIGKSLLTLNLAMTVGCTNNGVKLWNQFTVSRPLKSVFLQSENTENAVWQRINKMKSSDTKYKSGFNNILFPKIDDSFRSIGLSFREDYFHRVVEGIKEQTQADILIVDPLISFAGVDENSNNEMRKSLDTLTNVCQKCDLAVILVHHCGKTGDMGVYSARGASSITDWASKVVVLNKDKVGDERCIRVINEKSRNFKKFEPFHLKMDENCIINVFDPFDKINLSELIKVFKNNNDQFDTQAALIKAIQTQSHYSRAGTLNMINKAVEQNLILKTEYGHNKHRYILVK